MQVYVDAYVCGGQRPTLGVTYLVFGGGVSLFSQEFAYLARPVSSMDLLVFSSSALRLWDLPTMYGLSVGSEDWTQDIEHFTSRAISPDPGTGYLLIKLFLR